MAELDGPTRAQVDAFDPDGEAGLRKRFTAWVYSLLPLDPVL